MGNKAVNGYTRAQAVALHQAGKNITQISQQLRVEDMKSR